MSAAFIHFELTATTEPNTLALHDALPISVALAGGRELEDNVPPDDRQPLQLRRGRDCGEVGTGDPHGRARSCGVEVRSEEHTSELQSHHDLVCRLLLEKKKASPAAESPRC